MRHSLLLVSLASTAISVSAGSLLVYDGLTGGTFGYTGGTPRAYLGQGFDIADPGGPPKLSSMTIVLVTSASVSYADTQIRVQFWDTYNSAASPVFSNPIGGLQTWTTGPVVTSQTTAFTFTLEFTTPIALTGLTGHGLTVNWQRDAGGGSFVDDAQLTVGLRTVGSADINTGANITPNSGFYRNAASETDFNFLSTSRRSLSGVTNGGLAFDLKVVAVPEPSLLVHASLTGFAGLLMVALRRRTA